jgi:hypothetical protein
MPSRAGLGPGREGLATDLGQEGQPCQRAIFLSFIIRVGLFIDLVQLEDVGARPSRLEAAPTNRSPWLLRKYLAPPLPLTPPYPLPPQGGGTS